MTADTLLSRLQRVRETEHGKWVACCPAHDDRSPSLSITELDDGRILVHCFAGCAVTDVVRAVGLDLVDLFPERVKDHRIAPSRRPFSASQTLACIAKEAMILAVGSADLESGKALSGVDRDRYRLAIRRVTDACRRAGVL